MFDFQAIENASSGEAESAQHLDQTYRMWNPLADELRAAIFMLGH
jgi:hypothetical protein